MVQNPNKMKQFLKVQKTHIVKGLEAVMLKGINLGGWLMMEGYILLAPNNPEYQFKNNFKKVLGETALKDFERNFRSHFIQENDFRKIKEFGFNCIRLPFHYRLVYKSVGKYNLEGLKILDQAIAWAKKYQIYIILDLHAAPGCQNHDWHSDSAGKAALWTNKINQKRTLDLWEFLADRYKNEEMIAGYDLLNEAVIDDVKILNEFYKKLIKTIRCVDKNHILFIEGNTWATDLKCLDNFNDDNIVLSIHSYEPLNFTFNFIPHLKYPSKEYSFDLIRRHLSQYHIISQKNSLPIFVGEFGANYREGLFGEDKWLEDNLKCFKEFCFHWTYWTYKAVKGATFPDGILSFYENPLWVNRMGPVVGWDTYAKYWKTKRKEITDSWLTRNFKENTVILKIFKKYA